jgi:hypothetical protein
MKNHYRTWTRVSGYATAALIAATVPFLLVGGEVAVIGGIIGGSLAFAAALTAGICWFYARKADRHLEAFRRGEYLAHWTFRPEEWSTFAAAEWARTQKTARWMPLWLGLVGGAVGLGLLAAGAGVVVLAVSTLAGTALGWGVGRLLLSRGERARDARPAKPEVYVGPEAAVVDGKYIHWTGYGVRLVGLTMVGGDPPVLEFEVRTSSGESTTTHTHRVPVPAGREEEAEQVMEHLGF